MTKRGLLIIALALCPANALAQAPAPAAQQPAAGSDPAITSTGVIGEVTAVNLEAKGISIRTDAGSEVIAVFADNAVFKRLPPGEMKMESATDMKPADLVVGDRVFARGRVSDDRRTLTGRIFIVNTKADIAKKQERDRLEWQRRGVYGTVTAVNPATQEITINARTRDGVKPVVIAASAPAVQFRRYAPDSVKFSDAKTSSFAEVRVGDMVRALGDRSPDGAKFTPEQIVSGSFKTIIGTVASVDAAAKQIKLTPNGQKQPVTVVVNAGSNLRKLDPGAAQMLAFMVMRAAGGGAGPGGPGGPGGIRPGGGQGGPPQGAGEGQGGGGPRRGMGGGPGGGFELQDVIDRQPQATVAELKAGDVIIVSSTAGADPTRLTAVTLLAGVDQVLAAMQARPGGRPGGGAVSTSAGLPEGIDIGIGPPL